MNNNKKSLVLSKDDVALILTVLCLFESLCSDKELNKRVENLSERLIEYSIQFFEKEND